MSNNFNQDKFNQEKNEAKDKVKDIYDNTKKQATDAYEEGRDKAQSAVEAVQDMACDLYHEGKKYVHVAEKYAVDTTDELIKSVKEKPLTSVLIAGAIGWVLSSLLKK